MKYVLVFAGALLLGACGDDPPPTVSIKADTYAKAWPQATADCKKMGGTAKFKKLDENPKGPGSYIFACDGAKPKSS